MYAKWSTYHCGCALICCLPLASCDQMGSPDPAQLLEPSAREVGQTSQELNSVNVWADPSSSQTITQPSGTTLTLKATVNGVINVNQFVTGGSGTASSPWTGWEAGLNNAMSSATVAGEVYFPAGKWKQTVTIKVPAGGTFTGAAAGPLGWTLRGAGKVDTVIYMSDATADGIQSISNYNSSTGANLLLEDFKIVCGSLVSGTFVACSSPAGAGIDVVGGTYVNIKRVGSGAFKHGIVFDQAEISDIEACELSANSTGGIWLVNNTEHQTEGLPGVPSTPAAMGTFTNRIGVRTTEIDTDGIGIADDGGYTHVFENNNFNGGTTAIHLAGVEVGYITGNEFEGMSSDMIVYGDHTAFGNLSGPGGNSHIHIANNFLSATGSHSAVKIVSGGSPLFLDNNYMNSAGAAVVGVANLYELNATNARNFGGGPVFDSNPTVGLFSTSLGVGVGISTPAAALDVKGDVQTKGGVRLNTTAAQPTCAAATRGEFWFTQGASGVKDGAQVCAKDATDTYAWRVLY